LYILALLIAAALVNQSTANVIGFSIAIVFGEFGAVFSTLMLLFQTIGPSTRKTKSDDKSATIPPSQLSEHHSSITQDPTTPSIQTEPPLSQSIQIDQNVSLTTQS